MILVPKMKSLAEPRDSLPMQGRSELEGTAKESVCQEGIKAALVNGREQDNMGTNHPISQNLMRSKST